MIKILHSGGGHASRSAILTTAFESFGQSVFSTTHWEEVLPVLPEDILIVDMPGDHIPFIMNHTPIGLVEKVVLMGVYDPGFLCWHPLGPKEPNVIRGLEYLIVDSIDIPDPGERKGALMYFGETHPLYEIAPFLWELDFPKASRHTFVGRLAQVSVALLGWGQSCFEAAYLGTPFLAVAAEHDQIAEAWRFGASVVHWTTALALGEELLSLLPLARRVPEIDARGAYRTARRILEEQWLI